MAVEQNQNQQFAIEMQDACMDFGGGAGVFDLNIKLQRGTILGMIGPSGCGKTTTIRLLNGVYTPTSGEALVFGKIPSQFDQTDKNRIGYIPQQFILYPTLTVEENLHFLGGIYGMTRAERNKKMKPLLDFVELDEARKRLGSKLSGGMQRRLMLASALLHEPELLFADEPTAGIDPILRARVWDNFRELRDQGKTMLVTTQYVGEAAYCDLVAVMRKGRLLTIDTPENLRRQAMGGEVILLQLKRKQVYRVLELLNKLPDVIKADRIPEKDNSISAVVENAGDQLPVLLSTLNSELDITPKKAELYIPPFDEVFVRLIQRTEVEA